LDLKTVGAQDSITTERLRLSLRSVTARVQEYTKAWPEPLRYPVQAALASGDTDGGFERLLRSTLEGICLAGDVSAARELGFGDGRSGAIVPSHELDLIVRTSTGSLVLEAKCWQDEVDKDPVIVFLGKVLDFMWNPGFGDNHDEEISLGFIGLKGFSQAALRLMFAFGVVPFTQRGDQLSFLHLDSLLEKASDESSRAGWNEIADLLVAQRTALAPFISIEGRSLGDVFHCDADSAAFDLGRIKRAANVFEESRAVHNTALSVFRDFLSRWNSRG
jgi:hypothetical protein